MVRGAAGAVGGAASITSAGAAGRGGTEGVEAAASVGAELPRARFAARRRLSAFAVNRGFEGIEERSFPFLSTRRSAVVRNRLMLHQQCMRMEHRAPESRGALLHGRRREQTAPNIRHLPRDA